MIKGKIYKIYSIDENINDVYYGSTIQPLSGRMSGHRSNYKRWKAGNIKNYCSSFKLFENFGIDKFIIELIESLECNAKEELKMREGFYIKNNNCVNKQVAGRTIKETQRNYYINNEEKIKQYYLDNIDKRKEYIKNNIDKIKDQKGKLMKCDCGCEFTQSNKARHLKSKKHLDSLSL